MTVSWRISKLRGRQSQSTTPHPDRRFGEGATSLLGKGRLQEAKSFQVLKSHTTGLHLRTLQGIAQIGWGGVNVSSLSPSLTLKSVPLPASAIRVIRERHNPCTFFRTLSISYTVLGIIVITVINGETLEILVKPRAGDSVAYPILSVIAFCTPISGSNDRLLLHPGCEVPRRIQVKSSMLLRTRGQIALQNFSLTRTIGSFDGNIDEFSLHSREQAASRDFRDFGLARRHWENESLPVARLIAPPLSLKTMESFLVRTVGLGCLVVAARHQQPAHRPSL
jgi:hypothetical protein